MLGAYFLYGCLFCVGAYYPDFTVVSPSLTPFQQQFYGWPQPDFL